MKNYAKTAKANMVSSSSQKMSWRARLAHWLTADETNNGMYVPIGSQSSGIDRGNGTVTFTVHPASGGYVIESSYYDDRKDRHERNLHIITSQEDFSEELGKAVFMDMLKNR